MSNPILRITVVNDATSEVLEVFYTDEEGRNVANAIQDGLSCYDSKEELIEANNEPIDSSLM